MTTSVAMSDERLAWIGEWAKKVTPQQAYYGTMQRFMRELLDEAKRSRAVETKLRATIADEHTQLSQDLNNAEEVERLRTELVQTRESYKLSEAQLVEVTLERAEWRKQAQQHETVAKILRADLAAANKYAEEQAKAHDHWLCYSGDLENKLSTERQRVEAVERELTESRNALAVAAELIDRLAFDDECDYDHHDYCQAHNLQERPCPHPLGRQFVAAWRAVETEQQKEADDGLVD